MSRNDMNVRQLILRGLGYYWRTHLAVVLGVATAVAVLAGALLVGDSVRGSLRALVLDRLGNTAQVVVSAGFFREALANDLVRDAQAAGRIARVSPLISMQGFVTAQESGRRAGRVRVYGVDDRFWTFHDVDASGPADREAFVSEALATQLALEEGASLLVRVQRPTDVPLESLHGRRHDVGRTLRLAVRDVLPRTRLGEFSLDPQQGEVRAIFVPLSRLQRELDLSDRVNTLLVSAVEPDAPAARDLEPLVRTHTDLADMGVTVRALEDRHALIVESEAGLLDETLAAAAERAAAGEMRPRPVLTYLANSMRIGEREIPYSLVTAMDLDSLSTGASGSAGDAAPPIVLNDWAAADLRARVGDSLTLDYYLWEDPGQLVTRSRTFRVAGVVPIAAGDRDLAPTYPGITDSPTLDAWDPPFPLDLRRVRPVDEAYWNQHRTTPKAFIPLEVGQEIWRSRYGALTSMRVAVPAGMTLQTARDAYAERLAAALDPLAMGMLVRDVRAEGLAASRGATDFGEYFVYFSFFLVVSALVLAALFFKLGVEQRAREVGLLRAVGFSGAGVRRLFLGEALLLALAGSVLGLFGAVGYAWLMMYGLRSWWVDAVGTTALTLHVSPLSPAAGALGGLVAAVVCIWWTLRALHRISERSLLAGQLDSGHMQPAAGAHARRRGVMAALSVLLAAGGLLLAAAANGWIVPAAAFFGAGSALLGASLCLFLLMFRRPPAHVLAGSGWQAVSRLGIRNASYRPGRSVLSIAVIASATFILIAVDAFRRDGVVAADGPHTGLGGYALVVETLLPMVDDPNTPQGREALNLFDLDASLALEPFRLLPGDDASCLNLYEPTNPRILAPRDAFLAQGRFVFQDSLAQTDAERANPWLLLRRPVPDGAIPVIGDANSLRYVLHKQLGEDIVIARGEREVRLRVVAALRDSIFQSELLMSQDNFIAAFPEQEGYQVLLVEGPGAGEADLAATFEDALADFGAEAVGTAERLAAFHRVENTYLSTFQTLGGLGLLLGTVGLAAVLLRNVLERRRELALLGAVGYRRGHFLTMVVAENTLLLAAGLATGAVCAGLAIAPAVAERGGRLPLTLGGALLLFAVLVVGLLSSVVAIRAATHAPLLAALRSE